MRYLVMPHVRYVYVLQLLVRLHVRHVRLSLHIVISLKGRTTCIWSFSCSFDCATTMGCSRFRLLFGTIIAL